MGVVSEIGLGGFGARRLSWHELERKGTLIQRALQESTKFVLDIPSHYVRRFLATRFSKNNHVLLCSNV